MSLWEPIPEKDGRISIDRKITGQYYYVYFMETS